MKTMAHIRMLPIQTIRNTSRLFATTASSLTGNIPAGSESSTQSLGTQSEVPKNYTVLKLYSLLKQAAMGKSNAKRSRLSELVRRAKEHALGDIRGVESHDKYTSGVDRLTGSLASQSTADSRLASEDVTTQTCAGGDVLTEVRDKMHVITLNRPAKKNALRFSMYADIMAALGQAAVDDTEFVVMTGTGDYYCSGNDLTNFTNVTPENVVEFANKAKVHLQNFVDTFICFHKPLVAVVNGPAVGIPVTLLGLFDVVYATERATFATPFAALGQTPQACSTLTFPRMMGPAAANEMLMYNKKITAAEAMQRGLVTDVFPHATFHRDVMERLDALKKLPSGALRAAKLLKRQDDIATLRDVNERECELFCERWQSKEYSEAIRNFFRVKN